MQNDAYIIIASGLVAFSLPLISRRWYWFVLASIAAAAVLLLGLLLCAGSGDRDSVRCLLLTLIAAVPVAGGMVFGLVRVMASRSGKQPANTGVMILAAAAIICATMVWIMSLFMAR